MCNLYHSNTSRHIDVMKVGLRQTWHHAEGKNEGSPRKGNWIRYEWSKHGAAKLCLFILWGIRSLLTDRPEGFALLVCIQLGNLACAALSLLGGIYIRWLRLHRFINQKFKVERYGLFIHFYARAYVWTYWALGVHCFFWNQVLLVRCARLDQLRRCTDRRTW